MLLYFTALQNEINFCSILVTKMIGLGTFFSLKGSKLSLVVEIVSDALMRLPARLPTYQHPCQGKLQFEVKGSFFIVSLLGTEAGNAHLNS